MKLAGLHPGDTVEVNVRGVTFPATFRGADGDGNAEITPLVSWATWRVVSSRRIVKKIECQERMAVA